MLGVSWIRLDKFLGRNGLTLGVTPLVLDCQHPKFVGDTYIPVFVHSPDIVVNSSLFTLKYLDLVNELRSHHTPVPFKSNDTNLEN